MWWEVEQGAKGHVSFIHPLPPTFIYCCFLNGVKKTNTKTEPSLPPRLRVCLPPSPPNTPATPPLLSPSCPVMCSGQTVWLLGVSGMIIETEASKDIPRCLAYPENEPGLFRLGSLLTALSGTVVSCRLRCTYRGVVFFCLFFKQSSFTGLFFLLLYLILVLWSFCFRFPF